MNTVIKGTKTIAEYKRVREDMENLARANYARHKEAFEEWGEGEPVKAWFDFEGNFCIEYESGKWWHYGRYFHYFVVCLLCFMPIKFSSKYHSYGKKRPQIQLFRASFA